MVKIYLNDKKKYVNVNIWSLVKANLLSGLIIAGIIYGAMAIIFILVMLIALIVKLTAGG
jgi:hypothetical protein